jgi:hypothetical protein
MTGIFDWRQWRHPREFRIPPAASSDELVAALERLAAQLSAATVAPDNSDAGPPDFLADVCTGLWRLRQRMLQPGTDRPFDGMQRAYRHLESTLDALAQAGVEIIDHTGAPFDAGLSIKVIAYQPTPGVTRERVVETLRPTVYFKQQRLQMGEVIVATPEAVESGSPAPPAAM